MFPEIRWMNIVVAQRVSQFLVAGRVAEFERYRSFVAECETKSRLYLSSPAHEADNEARQRRWGAAQEAADAWKEACFPLLARTAPRAG